MIGALFNSTLASVQSASKGRSRHMEDLCSAADAGHFILLQR